MPRDHVSAKAEGKSISSSLAIGSMTSPISSAKAERRAKESAKPIRELLVSNSSARKRVKKGSATTVSLPLGTLPAQSFTDPTVAGLSTTFTVLDRPADAVHVTPVNQFASDGIGTPSTERTDQGPSDIHPARVSALSQFSERRDHFTTDTHHSHAPTFTLVVNESVHAAGANHRIIDELAPSQQANQTDLDQTPTGSVSGSPLSVVSEFGHFSRDAQTLAVELAPQYRQTIDEIREQWRRRQSWHKNEKSLTLSAKGMCRRLVAKGDEKADLKEADALYNAALGKGQHQLSDVAFGAIFPITRARDGIEVDRKAVEKRGAKLVKTLPIAAYIEEPEMRGVGIGSLFAIIGEAGDLGSYANPAKLWKRMGLAVMPDGRQRKVAGIAAIEHGYSPQRRAVMWNIGDCIVKAGGPLRELYDARKAVEHEKAKAEGLTVLPAAKIPKKDAHLYRSEGHVHNRAKRYVEKRVLLLLWRAWRRLS